MTLDEARAAFIAACVSAVGAIEAGAPPAMLLARGGRWVEAFKTYERVCGEALLDGIDDSMSEVEVGLARSVLRSDDMLDELSRLAHRRRFGIDSGT